MIGGEQVVDLLRRDWIEPGRRLVVDHQLGVGDGRARDPSSLFHAAGELGALAAIQTDGAQSRGDALGDRCRVEPAALLERERDVALDGQKIEQRVVLEQHADAPADRAELGLALPSRLSPRTSIEPRSGASSPHTSFNSTLLPDAAGPTSPSFVPRSSSSETPASTSRRP